MVFVSTLVLDGTIPFTNAPEWGVVSSRLCPSFVDELCGAEGEGVKLATAGNVAGIEKWPKGLTPVLFSGSVWGMLWTGCDIPRSSVEFEFVGASAAPKLAIDADG